LRFFVSILVACLDVFEVRFIYVCIFSLLLSVCKKINAGLYPLPYFPSNDWSNIKHAPCVDADCNSHIFSNLGTYELLVETEGCLGLGLMLGRKEITSSNQYIGEYTGIVKVYDESDSSNYNATLVEGQFVIDAKDSYNVLKYCNHSCKPNAYLKVCGYISGEPRIIMFSKGCIKPFSWINICYGKGKGLKAFFASKKCFCYSCLKKE